jgi:hypothetical protein
MDHGMRPSGHRHRTSGSAGRSSILAAQQDSSPAAHAVSVEDTPTSNERDGSGVNIHAIVEKIRQLARQTLIAEIQQELFDLADRLEQMGEGHGTTSSGEL